MENLLLETWLNRKTLLLWEDNPYTIDIISNAKNIIASKLVDKALKNEQNVSMTQYLMNNNLWYNDWKRSETKVQINNTATIVWKKPDDIIDIK
jgi:hypothetical protein